MFSEDIVEIIKYTKNFSVLYVEDNLEVQEQTHKMLQSFFNKITIANNGQEAIELFINNKYDLIITDLMMPQVDGLSLIDFIRKSKKS